jgi:Flp pilus assembly protein TadG
MTAQDRYSLRHYEHNTRHGLVAIARGRAAAERGQALVEFVLVLPLLLLLVFGIVQFGLALNSANDETHLANEVARYAAINQNPSSESLQKWAKSQADSSALSDQEVCISFPDGAEVGKYVEVKVIGTINWLPVLKLEAASTTVEGKADMRLEASPSQIQPVCE